MITWYDTKPIVSGYLICISFTNTINIYNNTLEFSNIYSRQINSINLHTSSFDNASHEDKPSRISHNLITLCHELQVMFNCFLVQLYPVDGWYLNTNLDLTIHIYKRDNYNLMRKLSFYKVT